MLFYECQIQVANTNIYTHIHIIYIVYIILYIMHDIDIPSPITDLIDFKPYPKKISNPGIEFTA